MANPKNTAIYYWNNNHFTIVAKATVTAVYKIIPISTKTLNAIIRDSQPFF